QSRGRRWSRRLRPAPARLSEDHDRRGLLPPLHALRPAPPGRRRRCRACTSLRIVPRLSRRCRHLVLEDRLRAAVSDHAPRPGPPHLEGPTPAPPPPPPHAPPPPPPPPTFPPPP